MFPSQRQNNLNNRNHRNNNYIVNYLAIDNTIRFGGLVNNSGTLINKPELITINKLHPDTTYSISAQSILKVYDKKSSVFLDSPINTAISTTTYIEPVIRQLSPIIFKLQNEYNAKKVYDDSLVHRLTISNQNLISEVIYIPINLVNTRGKLGTGVLCDLSVNANNNITTIIGPTIDFTGFPITIPSDVSLNDITIHVINVHESHISNELHRQGFYLHATALIELGSQLFIPSMDKYNINIVRTEKLTNQTSNSNTYFYYDKLSSLYPSIGSVSISLINAQNLTFVSGINVFGDISLNIYIQDIEYLNNYFYNSQQIVSYSLDNGIISYKETNLNNITNISNYKPSGQLPPSFDLNNTNLNCIMSSYTSQLQVTATAYNIIDNSYSCISNIISIICDPESINFINSFPNSIPSVRNTPVIGFRVYSGKKVSNNLPPVMYNATTPYSSISYDHTISIATPQGNYDYTEELQIARGRFVTKALPFAYLNYTGFYGDASLNNIDYSIINANQYRYATFVWSVQDLSYSELYTNLNIILEDMSSNPIIFNTIAYLDSSFNSPIELYYRLEDKYNPIIGTESISTYWIAGNNKTNPLITSSNYNLLNYSPYTGVCYTDMSGNQLRFNVLLPYVINSNNADNINIYVRIGIPLNTPFSFTNLKIYLEKNPLF